jgi:hypothetical protein
MRFITIIILAIFVYACNNSGDEPEKPMAVVGGDTSKIEMADTTKKDILEQIDVLVRSGFYDDDEIFTSIDEYLYEIPFDHNWTKEKIHKAYSDRVKEQASWPAITDFDKLVQAFDKLNSSGIIALHNAGVTKQDGEEDCKEIHDELLKKGVSTKGFCYYHWQDVERVVDDNHLLIGFGDFNNNDGEALEIGKQVATALESKGFKLKWDKTVAQRIEITNIKWQKRFGNDNCGYEKSIALLSRRNK